MISMRAVLVCVALTGCGFSPHDAVPDGPPRDTTPGDGSGSNIGFAPVHLTLADGQPGSTDLVLDGVGEIDTTNLLVSGHALVAGELDLKMQVAPGGSQVAVLHVRSLKVSAGANITVSGMFPLIVVASESIDIAGTLDASAHGTLAGPGGRGPGGGPGAGARGGHAIATTDTGGGGGGFGEVGGAGGDITGCAGPHVGGVGGPINGDGALTVLVGGSGGGAGESGACNDNPGGAGGGAIQLTSWTNIVIESTGVISAGGGGGQGGIDCGSSDGNSGAGGGSGGAIVLQASNVDNYGVVAANGGGGGGGGSGSGDPTPPFLGTGDPGENAGANDVPAMGGAGVGGSGFPGANGGAGLTPAEDALANTCGNNAGGGGGAVGRIAVAMSYTDHGITSPAPDTSLPCGSTCNAGDTL